MKKYKPAEDLRPDDFKIYPLWRYLNKDEMGETMAAPLKKLPAKSADECLTGIEVRLASGKMIWALICNVSGDDAYATKHLMNISFFEDGKVFHLARYHDACRDIYGPEALSKFLGMKIDDVFPIQYDLRALFSAGDPSALAGTIDKDPAEMLNKRQILDLIVWRNR